MISVLAQERVLGAALGAIFTGVVVFEQRRDIYHLISQDQPQILTPSQMREPVAAKSYRSDIARLWNQAIDNTLGPVIASLGSRGW